jgi:hypothetical protein
VSELDPSPIGSLHDGARTRDGEMAALIGDRAEREGLPRNYRMRADAHYVDQLDRPIGPVVRLIGTRHIDAGELPAAATLTALTQSIAAHGVLQPLLVRRSGNRYQLIAGRKRLAAAIGGGLNEVPCIIHEISEAAAERLAETERLSADAASAAAPVEASTAAVFSTLSRDLARIGSLADVLELATNPFQHRAAADFLKAEAWRAAWLVSAAAIAAKQAPSARPLSVGRALDRVRLGFEPEMRLAKLQLEFGVAAEASDVQCDEDLCTVTTGLVLASLSWLHGWETPRIEVRADAPASTLLRLQIVQRLVPPPAVAGAASVDLTETIAFAAADRFASARSGSVEVGAAGTRGTLVQLVITKS